MYEDRTQNYDPEIHDNISYMIHPFPFHIIYIKPCADHIAINAANETWRQKFSAV